MAGVKSESESPLSRVRVESQVLQISDPSRVATTRVNKSALLYVNVLHRKGYYYHLYSSQWLESSPSPSPSRRYPESESSRKSFKLATRSQQVCYYYHLYSYTLVQCLRGKKPKNVRFLISVAADGGCAASRWHGDESVPLRREDAQLRRVKMAAVRRADGGAGRDADAPRATAAGAAGGTLAADWSADAAGRGAKTRQRSDEGIDEKHCL